MKKRILIIALHLFVLLSSVSNAEVYSGKCGDNANWSLDTETGILEITGRGKMEDFNSSNVPWYNYKDFIRIINISNVTSIGDWAFSGCMELTSITIPSSVTSIGNIAFESCWKLSSIYIPSSVTRIGDYAFCNSGLTSINIPSSVTSVGNKSFMGCSGLTSIKIPSSVTSIGDYAFYYCSGLTSIRIPSSVKSIGNEAFCGCSRLTSIIIPASVTSIGKSAFGNCTSIESIIVKSPKPIMTNEFPLNGSMKFSTTLYIPAGSENEYYNAPGWKEFFYIKTYDPTKESLTLKIKYTNLSDTEYELLFGDQFSTHINIENVQKVSFNGKDVTAGVVNGEYITPAITANSELVIDYKSAPSGDDIDGDGEFTISDITELIKHYLEAGE